MTYIDCSGRMSEAELVMVKESEELEAVEELQHEMAAHDAANPTRAGRAPP